MTASFDPLASYAQRGLNADRLAAIERHSIGSVLDVGCGSAAYVSALASDRYAVGLDDHTFSTWKGMGRCVAGDASRLPFHTSAFDTLLVFETLEHLSDPVAALREYHRVTRRKLLLTVPNCTLTPGMRDSNLIYHHWIDPTHQHFWSLDQITDLVEQIGFRVVEQRLINQIDPAPFLMEILRLPSATRRAVRWLCSRWLTPYRMTSLVAAEKR